MKPLCNVKLLAAAFAAAALIAIPAFGQVRVGQDGHSNDASNRVGSGGYNAPGTVYSTGIGQNNIIYNNVTGFSGFTGPLGERDPGAFTGPSPSIISDNFIRTSSGAPSAYQAASNSNTPTAFYGDSRNVAPPIGTERQGFTGTYVGTQFTPPDSNSLGSEITSALDVQRQTYGESTVLGVGSKFLGNGNPASQTDLGGPLEAVNSADNFVGSPLYGLQGLNANGTGDTTDFGLPVFGTPSSSSTGTGRFRARSTTEIDQLQKELLENPDDTQTQNGLNSGAAQNGVGQAPGAFQKDNLTHAIEAPLPGRIDSRTPNSALNSNTISGTVNTQQSVQQRVTLMTPQQQSAQYNVLYNRLQQIMNPQMMAIRTNVQNANAYNQNAGKASSGGQGEPTSRPVAGDSAGAWGPVSPGGAPNPNIQPLKVQSLADGISAKGLHDLLKSGEDLMRQGKFQSAVQKYNLAQQVAPNNGLIPLGRANAELGAGYYALASADLHQVFQNDPALLLGQYDLRNWLGDKRLQFINGELNGLSNSDPKQETPAFLLAYIAYNTGREADAEKYLKEARARSGGHDLLLSRLEASWKLSASPALNGNK